MDDKPLDLGKQTDSSPTKPQLPAVEKRQDSEAEGDISHGEPSSQPIENSEGAVEQDEMKSVYFHQENKDKESLESPDKIPESCVTIKGKMRDSVISSGPKILESSASDRRGEHVYPGPSTSAATSCSDDSQVIQDSSQNPALKLPFVCEYCQKGFKYHSKYTQHARMHTGVKPFKCDYCDKRFSHRYDCKVHTRSHTKEKPFACSRCDMKFSQSGNLSRHFRRHTGEMSYICPTCGRAFIQKVQLQNHEIAFHKNKSKET